MKKLVVGVAAIGVVMALRPQVQRRLVQKMRDHCKQMATHCKEMMEAGSETAGHEAGTRRTHAHCEGMAEQHREHAEPVAAA